MSKHQTGLDDGDWVEDFGADRTAAEFDLGRVVGSVRTALEPSALVSVRWMVAGEVYTERPRSLHKLSAEKAAELLRGIGRCACGHVLDRSTDEQCRHCARKNGGAQ